MATLAVGSASGPSLSGTSANPVTLIGSGPGASSIPAQQPGQVLQPGGNIGSGGGYVLGTSTTNAPAATPVSSPVAAAPVVDPNAAKIAALISSGTQSAIAGGQGGTASALGNLQGLGDTLATNVQTGQNTINEARKNIGISQINSIKQLMNTIRQGLQGTGVALGNTGALDSSAATAAARAYANYGNVQTNAINNTAATGNQDQDVQQQNLDLTSTNGLAAIKSARDSAIGSIQAQAAQALQGLAATIAYLGGDTSKLPVQQIQDQIVQNAQSQLAEVDSNISSILSGVTPASADQTAQSAESASNAGVVPASGNSFQVAPATAAPSSNGAQFGGAPTSLIPLVVGKPQDQTTGP